MTPNPPADVNQMDADHRLSQSILDTLPSHVAVVDVDGAILAVNKAWTVFAATSGNRSLASTGVGANYLDVAKHATGPYSEEGQAAYLGIKAVLDGSLPHFSLEYPCHSASEQRWFLLNVSRIEEKPIRAVTSHLDITYRKSMENMLRKSSERFDELVDHLHQVFWIVDARTDQILYISPACDPILGRTCQSIYANTQAWLNVVHPDDQAQVLSVFAKKLDKGDFEVEFRILHLDGSVRWIWNRGYAVRDEKGDIIRFVGVADDMTDRKLAEAESAKLAAIIEYADDAIVSLTLNGTVISWNEGAERLYGYSAEEMIGHTILNLSPRDKYEEHSGIMARAKKGERVAAFETMRLRKDGTLVPVSLSASPVEVQSGKVTGVSKISHDISKVKLLEEQFRQAQKMEAVGTLAGGVAHDFNNLLTIINGYSEMLLDELSNDSPLRALVAEIHRAGERAGNLTRQLLAYSRKQILEPKVLNLNAIVIDTEMLLRRLIGEDIILTTVLDPALRPVTADPGQIQQVLMNLAVNARDAMPQGGRLTIETRHVVLDERYHQTHAQTQPGEYSMVAVTDTGTGMDEATRTRIFEPFFTTKGEGSGTGLGMAVVHGVVRQSGGEIEVYSELGKGTAFKAYFPVSKEALVAGKSSSGVMNMPPGAETILLVEDEDAVRALARHILQSCGYTLLEAGNGEEAIRVAQGHKEPIHLVVSDVVMPLLGGRQLAEQLEAMRPGLKTLFLSGYTDDAVVRHGILQADTAFLQKPFSPAALAQKVRSVLDQST
jgi:PAS domain S-box-containing protein